jgi:hypothetical protein
MPVMLAIQEEVIKGSQFQASLGKELVRSYAENKLGMVVHTCNPSYSEAEEVR